MPVKNRNQHRRKEEKLRKWLARRNARPVQKEEEHNGVKQRFLTLQSKKKGGGGGVLGGGCPLPRRPNEREKKASEKTCRRNYRFADHY